MSLTVDFYCFFLIAAAVTKSTTLVGEGILENILILS